VSVIGAIRRNLSSNLRRLRNEAGLTIDQLGVYSGVSPSTVYKLETGRTRGLPTEAVLVKLAATLKCSTDDLLAKPGVPVTDYISGHMKGDSRLPPVSALG